MVQRRQEAARAQKAKVQEAMGRRTRTTRLPEGRSTWRILPSWKGLEELEIAHAFGQHFVKDANGDLKVVHVCLEKTFGQECPICEVLRVAKQNADEDTKKLLDESRAGGRFLVNAYRVAKDAAPEVVILELPPTVYESVCDLIDQKADDQEIEDEEGNMITVPGIDVLDVKKGRNFIISKSGTGLTTKYTVSVSDNPTRVPPELLDKLNNLDEYVKAELNSSQGKDQKALTVISRVSTGALPSPASAANLDLNEDDLLDGEFEEVEEKPKKPSKSTASKAAVAAQAKAAEESEDEELDDILGELDDLDLDD